MAYPVEKRYLVTLARIILLLLVPLGGAAAAYGLNRFRHHCAHNDPLCRRNRPCIACYRELFKDVKT